MKVLIDESQHLDFHLITDFSDFSICFLMRHFWHFLFHQSEYLIVRLFEFLMAFGLPDCFWIVGATFYCTILSEISRFLNFWWISEFSKFSSGTIFSSKFQPNGAYSKVWKEVSKNCIIIGHHQVPIKSPLISQPKSCTAQLEIHEKKRNINQTIVK